MRFIHYDKELKNRARDLRNNSTETEVILWKYLRGTQVHGYKFTRQKPIHHYIVDFYSVELELAIEIDSEVHSAQTEYDSKRQSELESLGVTFLRVTNDQIRKDLYKTLETIRNYVSPLLGESAF